MKTRTLNFLAKILLVAIGSLMVIALYAEGGAPGGPAAPQLSQLGKRKTATPGVDFQNLSKSKHICLFPNRDIAETNSNNETTKRSIANNGNAIEYSELEKIQICYITFNKIIYSCMLCNSSLYFGMIEKNIEDWITIQEGEAWQPTIQSPDLYWVSSHGRVFSWKTKLKYNYKPVGLLKTGQHSLGYMVVSLDYQSPIGVHRVVAMAFISNPHNLPEINHIDHNKQHNHIDNLEWCTHAENVQASYTGGFRTSKKGNEHHRFGKTHSIEAKSVMSSKKLGENHPKFTGWYVIDGTKYNSANQAGSALGVPAITVTRRCKNVNIPNWEFIPKQDNVAILDI